MTAPAEQSRQPRTAEQIEADIEATRRRLADSLADLSHETQPAVIKANVKVKIKQTTEAVKHKAKGAVVGVDGHAPTIPPAATGAVVGITVGLIVLRVTRKRG